MVDLPVYALNPAYRSGSGTETGTAGRAPCYIAPKDPPMLLDAITTTSPQNTSVNRSMKTTTLTTYNSVKSQSQIAIPVEGAPLQIPNEEAQSGTPSYHPSNRLNVLIVDDSALTRKLMRRLIATMSSDFVYDVEEAASGEQALALIREGQRRQREFLTASVHGSPAMSRSTTALALTADTRTRERTLSGTSWSNSRQYAIPAPCSFYDLILVDCVMDGISGPEMIAETSAIFAGGAPTPPPTLQAPDADSHSSAQQVYHHGAPRPFVVGLTGMSSPADLKLFMEAGAQTVLVKPLDGKTLASVLRKYATWRHQCD